LNHLSITCATYTASSGHLLYSLGNKDKEKCLYMLSAGKLFA
jgi:hypothetical protein